jgi:hypothetical protein
MLGDQRPCDTWIMPARAGPVIAKLDQKSRLTR